MSSRPSTTSAVPDARRSIDTRSLRRTGSTAPRTTSSPPTTTTLSQSTVQLGIGSLIETIIEWAQCHYYTCDMAELRDLQERHRDLPLAVGDDVLTARWTAWVGMVTWQEGRIRDADRLLTEALDLGRRCDDATAQAYALTWLTWVATQAGDTARAVEIWPVLGAARSRGHRSPRSPVRPDQRARVGSGRRSARRGDTKSATAYADELLDIGRRTGNRRGERHGSHGAGRRGARPGRRVRRQSGDARRDRL